LKVLLPRTALTRDIVRKISAGFVNAAVLGWFLMTAPYVGSTTDRKVAPEAPLSDWFVLAPYDSLADCQQKRHVLIEASNSRHLAEITFLCISTADPRIELGQALH
jgi:hypothetical protein